MKILTLTIKSCDLKNVHYGRELCSIKSLDLNIIKSDSDISDLVTTMPCLVKLSIHSDNRISIKNGEFPSIKHLEIQAACSGTYFGNLIDIITSFPNLTYLYYSRIVLFSDGNYLSMDINFYTEFRSSFWIKNEKNILASFLVQSIKYDPNIHEIIRRNSRHLTDYLKLLQNI